MGLETRISLHRVLISNVTLWLDCLGLARSRPQVQLHPGGGRLPVRLLLVGAAPDGAGIRIQHGLMVSVMPGRCCARWRSSSARGCARRARCAAPRVSSSSTPPRSAARSRPARRARGPDSPAPTHKIVNLTRTRINYALAHAISLKSGVIDNKVDNLTILCRSRVAWVIYAWVIYA